MAKTLKDFLEGYLKVKSADEQKFIDKHVTAKNPDRNGNGDDVFKGKTKPVDRRKERHGYEAGEDEKVYEELKGGQKKLDKNKNGKLDAEDFKKLRKEEAEQIDELSKQTMKFYHAKASQDRDEAKKDKEWADYRFDPAEKAQANAIIRKRSAGIKMVRNKLKTEEVEQIDELDRQLGGTLSRYINKTKDNPKREAGRNLALTKRWGDAKYGLPEPKVRGVDRFKEEVEPIEELSKATLRSYAQNAKDQMSRSDTLAGREMGARAIGAKPSAKERMHNRRADKRHAGLGLAIDKLAREEVEHIEEAGYSAKAAAAGKDIGKPGKQFSKIANKAAAKYGSKERGQKVAGAVLAKLRKEEKLANMIADLSESHQRTMMNVFEKLNEDNKSKFLEACDTPEGVEQMLDFAINNKGE